jgi:O-antigen/teichoic acid export membrane protein
MEDLIWLMIPSVGVAIFSAVSRPLGLFSKQQRLRIAVAAVVVAGLFGLLIGPRCMCSNAVDLLLSSALFATLLGVAMNFLFSLGFALFHRLRSRSSRDSEVNHEA